jgi:hypothetical protein
MSSVTATPTARTEPVAFVFSEYHAFKPEAASPCGCKQSHLRDSSDDRSGSGTVAVALPTLACTTTGNSVDSATTTTAVGTSILPVHVVVVVVVVTFTTTRLLGHTVTHGHPARVTLHRRSLERSPVLV